MRKKSVVLVAYNEKGKEVNYFTSRSATALAGFDPAHVRKILRGERNRHNGCTFEEVGGKFAVALVERYGTDAIVSPASARKIAQRIA